MKRNIFFIAREKRSEISIHIMPVTLVYWSFWKRKASPTPSPFSFLPNQTLYCGNGLYCAQIFQPNCTKSHSMINQKYMHIRSFLQWRKLPSLSENSANQAILLWNYGRVYCCLSVYFIKSIYHFIIEKTSKRFTQKCYLL